MPAPPPAEPTTGQLLIAPPMVHAPTFQRTLVLLCDHDEQGSFGLVLSRPMDVPLSDVLVGLDSDQPLLSEGGPVQQDTLHFLHRYGPRVTGARPVTDGVWWGGDFGVVRTLIETGEASSQELRLFIGYAGWGTGQLQDELDEGAWIQAPASLDLVFPAGDAARTWGMSLQRLGGPYAAMAHYPEDPRVN